MSKKYRSIIANNLRKHRLQAGVSQEEIGNLLGISFQQIQKYEIGKNRISAASLIVVADFLKIPINSFYEQNDIVLSGDERTYGNICKDLLEITDQKTLKILAALIRNISKKNKMVEKHYNFEYEGETFEVERATKKQAEGCADGWWEWKCNEEEELLNGESREGRCEIVKFVFNEEYEPIETKRTTHELFYTKYHGDFAEHNTLRGL